jgi:hypothetical protein
MIKSTRNGYYDHIQDIRNLSARVENNGELGWVFGCSLGGELQFGRGEVGWERRRRRNIGRECRSIGGHIMVFSDGITDGRNPSVIPSVKVTRHCTVSQFESLGNVRR